MHNNTAFFQMLVKKLYTADDIHLYSLDQYLFDWRGTYRVKRQNGTNWVLRTVRQEGNESWYFKPAAVLLFLEQQGYPAPRLVRTRTGELIGSYGGWWTLMVTFVEGSTVENIPQHLRLLGNTIGALHNLSPEIAAAQVPPVQASWKQPGTIVPELLKQLTQIAEQVPTELQGFYDSIFTTLEHIYLAKNLPLCVIHADCYSSNAVYKHNERIELIDWDGAGFGPAVLDVGNLLLFSHPGQPQTLLTKPDATCIAAIIEGYYQQRQLTVDELKILLYAVRFTVAFHGAEALTRVLQSEWQTDARFQRMLARFAASERIAQIAYGYIET